MAPTSFNVQRGQVDRVPFINAPRFRRNGDTDVGGRAGEASEEPSVAVRRAISRLPCL